MIVTVAKYTLILFGLFFILVGALMLLKPTTARAILRKAGSSNLINYSEITLRLIPASALIIYADYSEFPESFTVFGWFMFLTSVVLYFVPKKLHHDFSNKCADFLKPVYFRIISPFAVIIGVLIIKSVV